MRIQLSDHFTYKRLLQFVFPTIVMLIVTSIYGIVDGLFISNIVGKNAFAAVNLIMPLLIVLSTFGFMIGTGGSALVSKTLGEGDKDKANQYFSMLVGVTAFVGIILSVAGFIFMRQIAWWMGANELLIDECVLYGRTVIVANAFFMLQNVFLSFFVVAEKPKMGLVVSTFAGIFNIILDFLMVYVLRMGVFGAALATSISQIVGAVIPLVYFLHDNNSLLRLVPTKLYWRALGSVCFNGSSEMMTNLSISIVAMLYNYQLVHFAGENGVAAYGVIMYVNMIFLSFFMGYSVGGAPIIGFNYGAKNADELKNLFCKSLKLIAVIGVVMTLVAYVLAEPLSLLFVGYDAELFKMTVHGMKLYSLSFLICGYNVFSSGFFTALSNGVVSAIISTLRTLVFEAAAVLIVPHFLSINGIWFAVSIAESMTLIVSVVAFVKFRAVYNYV